jgi:hypothetical protein
VKTPKPKLRHAEHVRYGSGDVLAVRQLDSAGHVLVADVRFEDGSERTIRLLPEYWSSSIADLYPTPVKANRVRKKLDVLAEAS